MVRAAEVLGSSLTDPEKPLKESSQLSYCHYCGTKHTRVYITSSKLAMQAL